MDPLQGLPDPDAMLALCLDNVEAYVLDLIAAADYGHGAPAHRAALDATLAQPALTPMVDWHPREVLSLVRWSRPDDDSEEARRWGGLDALGRSERHWARALATTLLLRAGPDGGENQTLAALLGSAKYLGPRAERATTALVAWRLSLRPGLRGEEEAFFWFALAVLGVRRDPPAAPDWLDTVCERADEAEARAPRSGSSSLWLLQTTLFDLCHGNWQGFATDGWHRARNLPTDRPRQLFARLRPELERQGT